jgi:hypothetical protein
MKRMTTRTDISHTLEFNKKKGSYDVPALMRSVKRRIKESHNQFIQNVSTVRVPKIEFNDNFDNAGFGGNLANRDKLYDEYEQFDSVCRIINAFFMYMKTKHENEYAKMEWIKKFLRRQIKVHENFIFEVTGEIREGKSTLARLIIFIYATLIEKNVKFHARPYQIHKTRTVILNATWTEYIHVYITYNYTQAIKLFPLMHPGDVLWSDEWTKVTGENTLRYFKALMNIIKTGSGKGWLNIIITVPDFQYIPEIHYIFDIAATNRDDFLTLALLSFVRKKDHTKAIATGFVICKIKEDPGFYRYYEKISGEEKKRIVMMQGLSTADSADIEWLAGLYKDAFDQEKNGLMKRVYSSNLKGFKVLARRIPDIRDLGKETREDVITVAYILCGRPGARNLNGNQNNTEEDEDEEPEQTQAPVDMMLANLPFEYNVDEILDSYKNQTSIQVYKRRLEGFSELEVANWIVDEAKLLEHCSKQNVNFIVKQVTGYKSKIIGEKYVRHLVTNKLVELGENQVEYFAFDEKDTKGKADIEIGVMNGPIIVYSVKCEHRGKSVETKYGRPHLVTNNKGKSKMVSGDFDPEIKRCQQLHEENPDRDVICFIHYYDYDPGRPVEREIDYMNPPITVSIQGLPDAPRIVYPDDSIASSTDGTTVP